MRFKTMARHLYLHVRRGVNCFTLDFCEGGYGEGPTETGHEDLHHSTALVIALASGISMLALAFRADFREPAADNGGDRTTWKWRDQNLLPYQLARPHPRIAGTPELRYMSQATVLYGSGL
jgi:hypothetical protein